MTEGQPLFKNLYLLLDQNGYVWICGKDSKIYVTAIFFEIDKKNSILK